MADLALLDDTGTVANVAVIGDDADQLLVDALIAAGNHTAGVRVPAELTHTEEGGVAIGWMYNAKDGFNPPPIPDPVDADPVVE